MKEKQSKDSWFVDPAGLLVPLLLAVVAVYFQEGTGVFFRWSGWM